MNNDLHVVYAIDDNFVILTSVSIDSLLANNIGAFKKISIHILDNGISETNKLNLTGIAQRYNNGKNTVTEIKYYSIDNISQLESLPQTEDYPVAIYFRFLIPAILSEDIKTCLYLDGDTIICKSLQELVSYDISDYDIGGVLDLGMSLSGSDNNGSKGKYVNSGVLLMNLVNWREKNLSKVLQKYANRNTAVLLWPDQDVINAVIPEESKLLLPPCYNNINASKYYSAEMRKKSEAYKIYGSAAIRKAKRNPVILHYGGGQFADGNLVYVKGAKRLFERYRKKGPFSELSYSEILNRSKGLSRKTLFAKRIMACMPLRLRDCVRNTYRHLQQFVIHKN